MTHRSLRLRLLLAAAAAVGVAVIVVGLGLVTLFTRHVERRIGTELDTYLSQLASRVTFDGDRTASIADDLADPRFQKVYGGLYWQVADETTGSLLRSRSLWDAKLELPTDVPELGAVDIHDTAAPDGATVLAHERRLIFRVAGADRILRFVVAIDRAEIGALTAEFAQDTGLSLLLLAAALLGAAWVQVNLGLRPLARVREGVAKIRDARAKRLEIDVPDEIRPLVDEVNALLTAQEASVARAKDRAADLAHGFKTPLTALVGDVARLRDRGEADIAADVEATALMMQRHIDRELVRSRQRNAGSVEPIAVRPVVYSLIRTLARTPSGETLEFQCNIDDGVEVRIDRDDLTEILGNLMDNAVRHARTVVRIGSSGHRGGRVDLTVEGDGPGLDARTRDAVAARGVRLDRSSAGAGLGLAIVNDILELYNGRLALESSDLGGLTARFSLGVGPVPPRLAPGG
jgi:signal transduction histidine kinase